MDNLIAVFLRGKPLRKRDMVACSFTFSEADKLIANECCRVILFLKNMLKSSKRIVCGLSFCGALRKMIADGYSVDKLLHKLELYYGWITLQMSQEGYFSMLQEIYNKYDRKGKKKV